MASAESYIKDIEKQVMSAHGGKLPENLGLTIRRYAKALELQDFYTDRMMKEGAVVFDQGSNKQAVRKQHPLCNLIYQQEAICQRYMTVLGLIAPKPVEKPKDPGGRNEDDIFEYVDGING